MINKTHEPKNDSSPGSQPPDMWGGSARVRSDSRPLDMQMHRLRQVLKHNLMYESINMNPVIKEFAEVDLNCIATFQHRDKEQEIFDLHGVKVLLVPRQAHPFLAVEVAIMDLVIDCLRQSTEDLVKISLCYSGKALQFDSAQEAIDSGFGFIVRSNSKYYFQPDQLDEVTKKLKRLDPTLARDTRQFGDMRDSSECDAKTK